MKKITLFWVVLCLVFAIVGCSRDKSERPFEDLVAEEVLSAEVCLMPPDETLRIPDTDELVALLRRVVTYEEDNSWREYNGQSVIFTLKMTDGSQREVIAFNPFVVIDGVGYRAEYDTCEPLSRYANELLTNSGSESSIHIDSEEDRILNIALVYGYHTYDYTEMVFIEEEQLWEVSFWENGAKLASNTVVIDTSGNVVDVRYSE